MTTKAYINHLTYYLPEKVMDNAELMKDFEGLLNEGDFEKVGIKKRYIVDEGTTGSDLAFNAAERLFEETHFDRNQIDALIYCSVHQDHVTPATSCILHGRLNLNEDVATYDITHGCSGYIYGLSLAKSLIESLGMKNILFLTGSALTKYIHKKDKASRMVFGDGASATIISASNTPNETKGIGQFILRTDGKGADKIIIKDGGERNKITPASLIEKTDEYNNTHTDASFYMNGTGILLFTLKKVPDLIEDTLKKNELTKNDIDLYILHQANVFIIEQVRKKMKIEAEKFFYSIENCGNTVNSTVAIALCEAIKAGKAKKGDKILIAGFGVGLSWGATVISL